MDVENSPNLAFVWGKYEQNVIDYEKEWYMLSFAYKWKDEKTVKAFKLSDFPTYKKDKTNDKKLLLELWKLLDEADIVIGHNVDRFDVRKTNARFLANGISVPSPYKTVDTLKVAKKYFFLNSNKLGDLGKYLKLGSKIDTGGFDLWLGCMAGDSSSWKKMVEYNKNDIVLLEKVYETLKPWMTNHPNVNVLSGRPNACPTCGSPRIHGRGYGIAGGRKKQKFQCQNCSCWFMGKVI